MERNGAAVAGALSGRIIRDDARSRFGNHVGAADRMPERVVHGRAGAVQGLCGKVSELQESVVEGRA